MPCLPTLDKEGLLPAGCGGAGEEAGTEVSVHKVVGQRRVTQKVVMVTRKTEN